MKPAPCAYHAPTELQEAVRLLAMLAPQDERHSRRRADAGPDHGVSHGAAGASHRHHSVYALDGGGIASDHLRTGDRTRQAYFKSDSIPVPATLSSTCAAALATKTSLKAVKAASYE